jgi:hypothetical protein
MSNIPTRKNTITRKQLKFAITSIIKQIPPQTEIDTIYISKGDYRPTVEIAVTFQNKKGWKKTISDFVNFTPKVKTGTEKAKEY